MNRKFFLMVGHLYRNKLKSPGFLASVGIMAAVVALLCFLPMIIMGIIERSPKEMQVIGLADRTGDGWATLLTDTNHLPENAPYRLEPVSDSGKQGMDIRELAGEKVASGEWAGILELRDGDESAARPAVEAVYWTDEKDASDVLFFLKQLLNTAAFQQRAQQLGLGQRELAWLDAPLKLEKVALEEGAKDELELNIARAFVYLTVMALYFMLIQYGNMVSTEVVVEKSSRVMEILVSSVPPAQQLFAKVLGVGLLALTQMAIVVLTGVFFFHLADPLGQLDIQLPPLPVELLLVALGYLILGYLLYATLLASLASLVSRLEDAGIIQSPVYIFLVGGFFLTMYGLGSPDSPLVAAASWVPFFTPMVMFLRIGMGMAGTPEVLGSTLLMAVTIAVFVVLGARWYKRGVFRYEPIRGAWRLGRPAANAGGKGDRER
ncbi:MAG: hypothetical protein BAA01_09095 [Bacillus thermozeamaize]|uniref:ABC-2 type transporter transmembrane domain-containing protein n=1 Tax=Bacillus thermozeamaize TaxID=230954 RepID=A0A1Y3PJF2_9BACI|nr:MAG: hypothetical protein BAA01_09095 [Bacillus thermozeamaize]